MRRGGFILDEFEDGVVWDLGWGLEFESDFDDGGIEGFGSVDADDASGFDACEAALAAGEGFGAGEVDFDFLSLGDGGLHGKGNEGAVARDVDALAVVEAGGLGVPEAHGPTDVSTF